MLTKTRISAIALAVSLSVSGVAGSPASAAAKENPTSQIQATVDLSKYVPIRAVCEWLGFPISWEGSNRTVTIKKLDREIRLSLAHETANDDLLLHENKMYIKQEALERALGVQVISTQDGKIAVSKDDLSSRAHAFVTQLQLGHIDAAYELTSEHFIDAVTQQPMIELLKQLSAFPKVNQTVEHNAVFDIVTITYQTPNMNFQVELRFDSSGLIDDVYVNTSFGDYSSPDYDHPAAYVTQEVSIGEGIHKVSGTLTIPGGEGPYPAVILVQGDGELDQDSTVFAQKPFRDLAVGLAAKEVAVLRMNKPTREHYVKIADHYTIEDEFVANAMNGVKLLQQFTPVIDEKRIYIAGHSRGGWMIPRILARDTEQSIAGAIVLAGADPRYTEIESYDHAESGGLIPEEQLDFYREQLKLVSNPAFDPANPPNEFILGPNPYWWTSIRDYDPAEEAALRDVPMLVLQGEQDFQVPKESMEGWKEVYANRENIAYITYPELTHLFTRGSSELGLANYMEPVHVDQQVINDIAGWLKSK